RCPYRVGNRLSLFVAPRIGGPYEPIRCEITRVFQPFFRACEMAVCLVPPSPRLPGPLTLKLFDRRFAYGFRQRYSLPYWTQDIEIQYREFLQSADRPDFDRTHDYFHVPSEATRQEWTVGQHETFFHRVMSNNFCVEDEAYKRLGNMQGRHVPIKWGVVTMELEPLGTPGLSNARCGGFLLQHIQGFPLERLGDYIRPNLWEGICRDAYDIVHNLYTRGIINFECRPEYLRVRPDDDGATPKVFMVDFSTCSFRRSGMSDNEWRRRKADVNEEGAIGSVMELLLQGGYQYRPSQMYLTLAAEFPLPNGI
ncbi:hypothetical protein BO71DRAFT_320495, partial [Aspergillus ellipticus CBS 707.79]